MALREPSPLTVAGGATSYRPSGLRAVRGALVLGGAVAVFVGSIVYANGGPVVLALAIIAALTALVAGVGFWNWTHSTLTVDDVGVILRRPGEKDMAVPFQAIESGVMSDGTFLGSPILTSFERRSNPQAPARAAGNLRLRTTQGRRHTLPLGLFVPGDADQVLRALAGRGINITGSPHRPPGLLPGLLPGLPPSSLPATNPPLSSGVLAAATTPHGTPNAAGAAMPNPALLVVAGVASAALGALLWGLILWGTRFESGIVASLIGAGCGYAVFLTAGRAKSLTGGAVALGAAISGTIAGKFLGIGLLLSAELQSLGDALDWGLFAQYFFQDLLAFYDGIDLLFFALALYAAWRIAGKMPAKVASAPPPL